MDRRRFLRYVGAGLVAATAAGAGYYLYNAGAGRKPQIVIPTTRQTSTSPSTSVRENHPPVANFMRRPYYLNPTDQQTIQFTSDCYDEDGDSLTYAWYVDGEPVGAEKDYSGRLPVGERLVELRASDGLVENRDQQTVFVEPNQIYPTKPLDIKYKGMRYCAGWTFAVLEEAMDEQLGTIHDDLGCNAIIIFALTPFEDHLIESGKLAIEKGFDRIYVTPTYLDRPIEETIERIGRFARKIKALKEMSDSVVFMVGHEFALDAYGIIPGDTWIERLSYCAEHNDWFDKVKAKLPDVFRRVVPLCKENYGYEVAYAAAAWEADLVPWSDPMFESVGTDAYLMDSVGWNEDWILEHFSSLRRFGKPINSTEWGCDTFKGAGAISGISPLYRDKYPYDEDEQANYMDRYCRMLNTARIDGCFYTQYNDESSNGYGLYDNRKRKKGFYMYKSYQRTS